MSTILQINAINEMSSTGRTTKELGDFLKTRGFRSLIAVAIGRKNEDTYIIGNYFDHKLHALFSRVFGRQGYFSRIATFKLMQYIKANNPDVVHLRNLHGNYINFPMMLKFLAKYDFPTVITLHDCWFYTGKCCHYTTIGCDKWKKICGKCPKLKDDNVSLFFDKTQKMQQDKKKLIEKMKYLSVVGVSDWITNEAKKSSVFSSVRDITRIYNWIDLSKFKPTEFEEIKQELGLGKKFVLLSVASGWSEKKGLDKILDLSQELPADVAIVLIGNCQIEKNNIPENIVLCGTVSNTDMLPKYYSMADVYLNLSMEESFGKVSAEALACGTPVIALNSTANGEIIGKGCGFVLENFDKKEVLNCIRIIREKKKESFTENCIKWAEDNFLMEKNAECYVELYNKLIEMKEKK